MPESFPSHEQIDPYLQHAIVALQGANIGRTFRITSLDQIQNYIDEEFGFTILAVHDQFDTMHPDGKYGAVGDGIQQILDTGELSRL